MRIGELAEHVGIAEHVLRHWDAQGVVVADRSASGHRRYTDEHLRRVEVVRACQRIGMSLSQIRQVLHRGSADRTRVLYEQLHHLREQQRRLSRAEQFLTHVIGCRHDLISECDECSGFAQDPVGSPRVSGLRRPASRGVE
ncbi:MerR family transcriptional regulator [Williamsia sp. Leaf354]|uniref:MerR family transcriptional regulator n=1 Tax=Williamsia sp. Leaf354 TaxID=1736349 RepID=UPI0009E85623|nr:MerR family transcriptional regulator [Williamsia sp. Leaf354]